MTRFARAVGSKGSNTRSAEEPTSWAVMKQQMLDSQKTATEEDNGVAEKIQKIKASQREEKQPSNTNVWADFDSEKLLKPTYLQADLQKDAESSSKKKKKPKKSKTGDHSADNGSFEVPEEAELSTKKSKKRKKEIIEPIEADNSEVSRKKIKKKKEKPTNSETAVLKSSKKDGKKTGKAGRKEKAIEDCSVESSEPNAVNGNASKNMKTAQQVPPPQAETTRPQREPVQQKKEKKKRAEKEMEGIQPNRRKPFNDTIYVDGRAIKVEQFDGFPVMQEDAARLKELKLRMHKEGIPKAEVRKAMVLERRRAEKALSREVKKVCFHCRKPGHVMSSCPQISTGACDVCFKCGSTEHKSPQCKVSQGDDYKFGTCFVCGETGHISRQCPDNPRGLYPQGGGCRLCGDVTHLKKDCPQLQNGTKDNSWTLSTSNYSSGIDSLDERGSNTAKKAIIVDGPRKNKIVKF